MKLYDEKGESPFNIGLIHFIGVGGIGMSAIAQILRELGYDVQGSDAKRNAIIDKLEEIGVKIFIGQATKNLENVSIVVKSSAIKDDNIEIIGAKKRNIPIILRADMLAQLMRFKYSIALAGSHGKTTTTTLMAALFEKEGLDPTVINGGVINDYNSNAKLGKSNWLIAEADESDGSFLKLPSVINNITNIDPEHLDHYGNFENLKAAFVEFIEKTPFFGFSVLCIDNDVVADIFNNITGKNLYSYGIDNQDSDLLAQNIRYENDGTIFDIKIKESNQIIKDIKLSIPGRHNVLNALGVITIALKLNFNINNIKSALENFGGVKRRFTITGKINNITIIDDYAHHPKEISATLNTAKQVKQNRVIAVLQPHRYSRVKDLFNEFSTCFGDADIVIICDIYEAGEKPIDGINKENLVENIKTHTNAQVLALPNSDDLADIISNIALDGDIVVCMGAGDISLWANELPEKLSLKLPKIA